MQNKEVIEKIKKLFAVAHNKGASDAEAQAAMLKAQRLMTKYNIIIEHSDDEEIVYERVSCATPGNKKFRVVLAQVVASNFRCQHYLSNQKVCFSEERETRVLHKKHLNTLINMPLKKQGSYIVYV